jgi:hypothetical protein
MFLETKGLEDKMLDHDEIRSIVDNVLGEEKPDDYLLTIETTKFINEEPFTELRFQWRVNQDYAVDIPLIFDKPFTNIVKDDIIGLAEIIKEKLIEAKLG